MFAGKHKFTEYLFLPTECALDQFRLKTGQPAIWYQPAFRL
jgi:hypothetical protein